MPDPMTAQDKLDVMELIARYAQCIDGGDLDGYVANFLPDGVIEWGNGVARGHEEIRSWVGGLMATGRIGGEPAFTRHFINLPYVTGDSQRATARTYVIIFSLSDGGRVTVPSVGSYADTCVKTPEGRWLFEKRVIASDLGSFTQRE